MAATEEPAMARDGKQFLERLRRTKRELWLEGARVDDVTAHPALAGGARTIAGVFDRQHAFASECLIPDPETGEPVNIGHMLPRSIDDLQRRNAGLTRLAEATVGLMGRTPDYMNVKFASFAARASDWVGAHARNAAGAESLVRFQRRIAREDISLTHTIVHPTIDKTTDAQIVGNAVPLHKVSETAHGIVVRGARILATLAPFADEIAVYPAHPLPNGAEAYALAFSIPVETVNRTVRQLLERGYVARGWLGAAMQPIRFNPAAQRRLGLESDSGLVILSVEPDGPAASAGLLVGDVIVKLRGRPIEHVDDLADALWASDAVGRTLDLDLVRGGERVKADVLIGERPRRSA